ncbi:MULTISPECIES: tRNA lysidine(34) synthetase TilS [Rhizobium]|uniref:tRNA lysidine(34) synthetase TilS n=1 Tax=Rhizobium TaxID=379 RepID=UPI000BE8C3EA|nr:MULTISPECIES: tRNA lysidine(34) synthetase TilS [Rhizobium]MBY4590891.1 tRNA lysidine(34) synthetase TilS [Rhizobium redzepovicii]MBY4614894.1 tRNA lysidine(34) synthetase TilS [Rhizobium redzepovicii]MDF0661527.1 tRNA lysidine(34) synthetase TilS [Rhizobium sp. BC49]PDS81920.1 tRNA lysidine(34) synthetase TilS [Rhizobium sp. L18]TBY47850.1 tRNA lysidine(34) synthetase TilS [Rhizobium leguminosarum bv. viciae]
MSPEARSPREAILQFLTSLQSPARILVAISGGSDSTGLLLLLDEAVKAAPHFKISLCAATVDHALRAGSADEAREVASLCASLGIAHTSMTWQGDKPKTGIMAAAREARYGLLAEAAEAFGADLIVTGHTFDDQRETLAMRGVRTEQVSSGIADAVLFDRRFWILRPLLFSSRADIRAFLNERGVKWIDDPSNEDVKHERVRVRRQLLADAGAEANVSAVWDERLAVSAKGAEWLDHHFKLHGGLLGQVVPDGLRQDRAVLDYVLGRLTAIFGGQPFAPGRAQIERLLSFAAGGEPGRMTVGRVVFDLRRDGLYLTRESRGILPLVLQPGEAGVWDGRFVARNGSAAPIIIETTATHSPSFLCLSQESSANKSLAAKDSLHFMGSITARTRGSWIPVTSTGIREHHIGHLPKAAWKRAIASAPAISAQEVPLSAETAEAIHLTPYFAPFDRFLTRFDFIFANRLSAVFATAPYARPPLRSIDGKTI